MKTALSLGQGNRQPCSYRSTESPEYCQDYPTYGVRTYPTGPERPPATSSPMALVRSGTGFAWHFYYRRRRLASLNVLTPANQLLFEAAGSGSRDETSEVGGSCSCNTHRRPSAIARMLSTGECQVDKSVRERDTWASVHDGN